MKKSNYEFTYSWYENINENGKHINNHKPNSEFATYNSLLSNCFIGCLTAIYDKDKLGKIYMPNLKKRQDFALWLQLLKKTDKAYLYPKITAIYTVRNSSLSSNKLPLIKYNWAIYRDVEKFNIINSSYYMLKFLTLYIVRKFHQKISATK